METSRNISDSKEFRKDFEEALHVQPKYLRLRRFLRSELSANRLKPGDSLPTEMELAKRLQVSRGTVRQALAELHREGLIERVRGRGTFVSEQLDDGKADEQPDANVNLGISEFALLVPESCHLYASLMDGFENASSKQDGQVTICNTGNDIHKQSSLILQLLRRKISGVAIVPAISSPSPAYHFQELQERGIPVVFCHRRTEGVKAPFLSIPFHQVGRITGETLIQHGHRRIAYISPLSSESTVAYKEGLLETLQGEGLELPDSLIYFGDTLPTDLNKQKDAVSLTLKRMLNEPDPPTAIFTSDDLMAEMLYFLLGSNGKRIPEDISLVSFGDSLRKGALSLRITAFVIDESDIGRRAVDLINQMASGQRPINDESTIVVPINLSEGRTLGSPPQR